MGREEIYSSIDRKVQNLRPAMKSVITNASEGISLTNLFGKMSETEKDERIIKSTFLNLASTEGLYLDKDRKVRISSQE